MKQTIVFLWPAVFSILISFLGPALSLKEPVYKHCINCKFFKNVHPTDTSYGKCTLFPIVENNMNYLVNGIGKVDYFYCTIARKDNKMCGTSGMYFKKNVPIRID